MHNSVERTGLKVTALVLSRLRRSDIRDELARLEAAPKSRAWAEIALVVGALFALALLAAFFGWPGLAVYFIAILLIFR